MDDNRSHSQKSDSLAREGKADTPGDDLSRENKVNIVTEQKQLKQNKNMNKYIHE